MASSTSGTAAAEAAASSTKQGGSAEFVIRAPYSRWKDVIRGNLEPVKGLVQGSSVSEATSQDPAYTKGTQELAYIAGQVDTTFPDEP